MNELTDKDLQGRIDALDVSIKMLEEALDAAIVEKERRLKERAQLTQAPSWKDLQCEPDA